MVRKVHHIIKRMRKLNRKNPQHFIDIYGSKNKNIRSHTTNKRRWRSHSLERAHACLSFYLENELLIDELLGDARNEIR